jgi:ABC-type phosphate transport system substrate-binding protein
MNSRTRSACHAAGAFVGLLGILAQTQQVQAADCSTLPNPVYVTGSSASKPFLAKVAAALTAQTPPVTLVYYSTDSCSGLLKMKASGTMDGTSGSIWDSGGTEISGGCTYTAAAAPSVDIGISDVYAASCPTVGALPAGVKDFHGPIQAMTFAVPLASKQQSISAEAAYLLMALGADGATPWTDMNQVFVRSETSGTQQMLSAAINVSASKWQGQSKSGSGDVVNGLTAATSPDLAIGILASDVVDKNRGKVRSLAYQHYGQSCGYAPDSDPVTSFDKKNVRDGHYAVWGPLHLIAQVDTTGTVTNASAKKVIDMLTMASSVSDADIAILITAEAKGGVVPDCAMRVTRAGEVGALASYMPAKSCECRFVAEASGAAPSSCTACTTNANCPASAPACNYGYCEVQ